MWKRFRIIIHMVLHFYEILTSQEEAGCVVFEAKTQGKKKLINKAANLSNGQEHVLYNVFFLLFLLLWFFFFFFLIK